MTGCATVPTRSAQALDLKIVHFNFNQIIEQDQRDYNCDGVVLNNSSIELRDVVATFYFKNSEGAVISVKTVPLGDFAPQQMKETAFVHTLYTFGKIDYFGVQFSYKHYY